MLTFTKLVMGEVVLMQSLLRMRRRGHLEHFVLFERSLILGNYPFLAGNMASHTKKAKRSTKESSPVSGGHREKSSSSKQQMQTVLAVFPDNKNGNRAYEALQMAVKDLKHTQLEKLPFEKLDYGETASLDKFYAANVAVVDVTERNMQAALFYQLGLRENFDMKNNVVTMLENQRTFNDAGMDEANVPASTVSNFTCAFSFSGLC